MIIGNLFSLWVNGASCHRKAQNQWVERIGYMSQKGDGVFRELNWNRSEMSPRKGKRGEKRTNGQMDFKKMKRTDCVRDISNEWISSRDSSIPFRSSISFSIASNPLFHPYIHSVMRNPNPLNQWLTLRKRAYRKFFSKIL